MHNPFSSKKITYHDLGIYNLLNPGHLYHFYDRSFKMTVMANDTPIVDTSYTTKKELKKRFKQSRMERLGVVPNVTTTLSRVSDEDTKSYIDEYHPAPDGVTYDKYSSHLSSIATPTEYLLNYLNDDSSYDNEKNAYVIDGKNYYITDISVVDQSTESVDVTDKVVTYTDDGNGNFDADEDDQTRTIEYTYNNYSAILYRNKYEVMEEWLVDEYGDDYDPDEQTILIQEAVEDDPDTEEDESEDEVKYTNVTKTKNEDADGKYIITYDDEDGNPCSFSVDKISKTINYSENVPSNMNKNIDYDLLPETPDYLLSVQGRPKRITFYSKLGVPDRESTTYIISTIISDNGGKYVFIDDMNSDLVSEQTYDDEKANMMTPIIPIVLDKKPVNRDEKTFDKYLDSLRVNKKGIYESVDGNDDVTDAFLFVGINPMNLFGELDPENEDDEDDNKVEISENEKEKVKSAVAGVLYNMFEMVSTSDGSGDVSISNGILGGSYSYTLKKYSKYDSLDSKSTMEITEVQNNNAPIGEFKLGHYSGNPSNYVDYKYADNEAGHTIQVVDNVYQTILILKKQIDDDMIGVIEVSNLEMIWDLGFGKKAGLYYNKEFLRLLIPYKELNRLSFHNWCRVYDRSVGLGAHVSKTVYVKWYQKSWFSFLVTVVLVLTGHPDWAATYAAATTIAGIAMAFLDAAKVTNPIVRFVIVVIVMVLIPTSSATTTSSATEKGATAANASTETTTAVTLEKVAKAMAIVNLAAGFKNAVDAYEIQKDIKAFEKEKEANKENTDEIAKMMNAIDENSEEMNIFINAVYQNNGRTEAEYNELFSTMSPSEFKGLMMNGLGLMQIDNGMLKTVENAIGFKKGTANIPLMTS